MTKPDYDLILIGAGLANTAIVLSLLAKNFSGNILLLEQQSDFPKQRTWCFWQQHLLPDYLQPLISHQWSSWSMSYHNQQVTQSCGNKRYAYCCIKGEAYYQYCQSLFKGSQNVTVIFNQTVNSVIDHSDGLIVNHNDLSTSAEYVIDSRVTPQQPYSDALKQSFVGAWVDSKEAVFNPNEVGLMEELQTEHQKEMSFQYILPFSTHSALIEYTTFGYQKPDFNRLKKQTTSILHQRWHLSQQHITQWEQGCLPMNVKSQSASISNQKYSLSGIAKGNIRPSTGYAF